MDILSVLGDLVHHQRGGITLYISAGEDERCAKKWCSFTSLGHPHPFNHEELIDAYHIVPVAICIKSNIFAIPHL